MLRRLTSFWQRYTLAGVAVALAAFCKAVTQPYIGGLHYTFFYPSIIVVTLLAGYRAGLVATALAGFTVSFWLTPTGLPLVNDARDLLGLLVFLANSVLIVAVAQAVHRSRSRAEQATAAQAQTEQRLSSILSNAPAHVFIKDLGGRYQMVNALFERAAGVAAGTMVGKTDDDLFAPEVAAHFRHDDETVARSRQPMTVENSFQYKGEELTFITTKFPLLDAAGEVQAVCGIAADVTQRKRSEDELRRSEARLGAVVRSALDCIVGMDHAGRVTEWNPAAERTFGFTRADALGREMAEMIIPPALRDRHRQGLARYLATGEGPVLGRRVELTAVRKDGSEFPIELTITPVHAEGPPSFTGFVRDTSEQKRADEARRMSEFRWQRLVEQSPLSTQIFAPDGTVRQVNRAWERLWGITPADIPGYNILHDQQLVDRGIMALIQKAFAGEAATAEPIPYTLDRGQYAGQARWCGAYVYPVKDDAGRIEEVVLVHNDVTEQRLAEEANARLAAMVRASGDAILSVGVDGTIQTWNPGAERLFGYSAEEAVGRPISLISAAEAPAGQPEQLMKRVLGGEPVAAAEAVRARKDGSRVEVSISIDPVRDAAGQVVAMAGVLRDITERRQAERERERFLDAERRAREEAEHASRMKDEFLATLSHELRTPLNAILGWSQILAGGSKDPEDLSEGLRTIERNARAQTQIIEDLLDMSGIISGKVRLDVQRIDLAPVVQAAVETVRPAADAKGIRVQTVLDQFAGPVSGDPSRLQQVFWNLLTNAVKFTPRGGRVQVLLERVNSHLEVSVSDTGEGITPEFLPHVFDRFKQADASTTRRHGGLGLGLSIVKQLIELHGGSIRATSAGTGHGSTFVVSLPLTVIHPEPRPPEERQHPRVSSLSSSPSLLDACVEIAGVKVLVVDDEPDARALVKRLLEDCKGKVVMAGSAEEALPLVQSERPDVLLCDIGMPHEDGYSLIRRVRALGPEQGGQVPSVALTAYARAEDRVKAVLAGFQMHLAKPVEPAELIATVASLAGRTVR